jgi:hypothetical protein
LPAKNEKLAIPNPGLEKVVQFCLTFPSGLKEQHTDPRRVVQMQSLHTHLFAESLEITLRFGKFMIHNLGNHLSKVTLPDLRVKETWSNASLPSG